jgi:sugar/nucleoside kinase (ribokinase family)
MVRENIDCLIIGDSFFDVTVLLPSKGKAIVQGGTTNSKSMFISPGGMGNVAVTVSKLGGKSAFCGMVGDDIFGSLYLQDLRENGVLPIIFTDVKDSTGILLSFVLRNGQRSFLVFRGANDSLKRHHIDKAFEKVNPKILHISGHSLNNKTMEDTVIYATKIAAEYKTKVLFDCTPHNLILSKRCLFKHLVERAYCLCLNLDEARALTGEKRVNEIVGQLKRTVNLLALKLGEKGCLVTSHNQRIKIKTLKVKTLDTTGAGDCFAAAIAYGMAKNLDNERMAKLGVQMGTMKVQHLGPRLFPSKANLRT